MKTEQTYSLRTDPFFGQGTYNGATCAFLLTPSTTY